MKNERRFYTYAYLREDGTPYYIGKGMKGRIHSSKGRRFPLPPEERRIFLKKNLTEEEAFKHEIYMIAVFGRKDLGTGILLNLTDGGEGITGDSPETRRKKGNGSRGKKFTLEHRRKLSEATLNREVILTETSRMKMSMGKRKKIEITFPSGRIGVFCSERLASEYLGISKSMISYLCRLDTTPTRGKFKDFYAKFI